MFAPVGGVRREPAAYIGCPVWAHAPWVGSFFARGTKREEFLGQYASVFGTAEGNATFYGLPKKETVLRWAQEAPPTFRFCFKFPRVVSHGRQLVGAEGEVREFLSRVEPLGERLGPFFLQLSSDFGASRLTILEQFLASLPRAHTYAVEVRHGDFFDEGPSEKRLNAILEAAGVDRVTFDTRGLFASKARDEITLDAKAKKPRVPVRFLSTGSRPFVRFVGDPEVEANDAFLGEWAGVFAAWIAQGKTPYFFGHHPDDGLAPQLCRRFQAALSARCAAVPPPAAWPGEAGQSQMSLL